MTTTKTKPFKTLQDDLRARLKVSLGGGCPTCGSVAFTIRAGAEKTGIPVANLHRFLSGKNADGKTLDLVDAYLRKAK